MSDNIPPILRSGDTGAYVERLQRELSQLGYEVPVDGVFGEATDTAVKKFQQDHNLTVDGIVGPQTGRQVSTALA